MTSQAESFVLQGGEDRATPDIAITPGKARLLRNYDAVARGYRRSQGFERFDGRTKPSTGADAGAQATLRAAIAKPTGAGQIRGGFVYNGDVYCFRDNAGATAGLLYKATTSGWASQDLGRYVDFTSGGTYEIQEGDTITGATSGATAVVWRMPPLTSGTWAAGDAAGRLWLHTQSGTFQSENLNVGANTNVATIGGNSTANALPAGGRYECIVTNFYANENKTRVYGCNGVGKGFEYNGTALAFIDTGSGTDTPQHVAEHAEQLFFSFPYGSLQNSGITEPLDWSAGAGAAEFGTGEHITGILGAASGVLIAFCRNSIHVLYGTDSDNFQLDALAKQAGAREWTTQMIGEAAGEATYLDDAGVRQLTAAQTRGDFTSGSLTRMVEDLFAEKRAAGVDPIASLVSRAKDQYWLIFDDGTGIKIYFGRNPAEITEFDLDVNPTCAWTGEDDDGKEMLFIGADDGWVYQLDSGTSADGADLTSTFQFVYSHAKSPDRNKQWDSLLVEFDGASGDDLNVSALFSFDDPARPDLPARDAVIRVGAAGKGYAFFKLYGLGTNIGVELTSVAALAAPHTLHGATMRFRMRGRVKG